MDHSHDATSEGSGLYHWLTSEGRAHTLPECRGDYATACVEAALCVGILIAYVLIARKEGQLVRELGDAGYTGARNAKLAFVLTFLICGLDSYLLPLIEMVWPVARLRLIGLAILLPSAWGVVVYHPNIGKLASRAIRTNHVVDDQVRSALPDMDSEKRNALTAEERVCLLYGLKRTGVKA